MRGFRLGRPRRRLSGSAREFGPVRASGSSRPATEPADGLAVDPERAGADQVVVGRLETYLKRPTGGRRYRRLDRHAGRDRVDPMPEQSDPYQPRAVFSVSVPVARSPSSYGSNTIRTPARVRVALNPAPEAVPRGPTPAAGGGGAAELHGPNRSTPAGAPGTNRAAASSAARLMPEAYSRRTTPSSAQGRERVLSADADVCPRQSRWLRIWTEGR